MSKLPLAHARAIAENLAAALSPACVRGPEFAGSIRREVRQVGDIELVAIPRIAEEAEKGAQGSLFDDVEHVLSVSALWDRIAEINAESRQAGQGEAIVPLKPTSKVTWEMTSTGCRVPRFELDPKWEEKRFGRSKLWKLWLPRKRVKVDLFMPTPATWGVVFLVRTGSRYFSQAVVERWTTVSGGGRVHQGRLHRRHNGGKPAAYKDGLPLGPPLDTPEEEDVFRACEMVWKPPPLRRTGHDVAPDPALVDTTLLAAVDSDGDLVVTVPMGQWESWIDEGDLPGDPATGEEWGFYLGMPPPATKPGARVYVVAHGKLRGYAPLTRVSKDPPALVRKACAVAVTIDEPIRGFRGCRYRWWPREDEKPFPEWRTP